MSYLHPSVVNLSLADKAALLSGADFWTTRPASDGSVPSVMLSDGPHGVRRQGEGQDHLGINASRPATAFPTASATACSWDVELLHRIGDALGVEARALGVDVLLGPGINIKRSPLCGRNFEYFSEDPLLSGELGAAWVRGLQRHGVGASVKHFAANNQETDRMRVSAEVDERTLREIYLRAFERIVKTAAPASVMASYNAINGTLVSENEWLLSQILRHEWGYDGVVVSDWGAVHDPVASVQAGLDLEMPGTGTVSSEIIVAAVEAGKLDVSVVDRAASRVLHMAERVSNATTVAAPDHVLHHLLAQEAAEQSAVLLRNEEALPFSDTGGTLLIVGELARTPRYQGAGSSHIQPTRLDDALSAITARAHVREVAFHPGYRLDGIDDATMVQGAVLEAKKADDIVVFLGLPDAEESESFDRATLQLPAAQLMLLEQLMSVTDRLVVVLSHGGAVATTPWAHRVAAVLDMGLGGQAVGSATARLLFGDISPSGKTAETIPHRLEDNPSHLNFPGDGRSVLYGERIYVGYRYYDAVDRDVAYPFGHGLSYTHFRYDKLRVDVQGESLVVELEVSNVGDVDASEVVQIYAESPTARVDRPRRELVGFAKVAVRSGETVPVRVDIALRDLDHFDPLAGSWARPGGEWGLWAAASSRDLRLRASIDIESTERPPLLSLDSNVADWLDSARGNEELTLLHTALDVSGPGDMDEHTLPLVRPLPLRNVLRMSLLSRGVQLDDPRIIRMVERANMTDLSGPEGEVTS